MKTLRLFAKTAGSTGVLGVCVLATALLSAQSQEPKDTAAGATNKETVAGATNYVRLDDHFASGGITTPEAFAAIKKLGFRTVVNLRTASEPGVDLAAEEKIVNDAGLRYVGLPFSTTAPDLTSVENFLRVARDVDSQPVYIHCQSGLRANAFWMIKRVVVDGWTTEKALAEADTLKMTNQRLREFVEAYLKGRQ